MLDGARIATALRGRVPFLIHSDLPDSSAELQTMYELGVLGKLTNGPGAHLEVADTLRQLGVA